MTRYQSRLMLVFVCLLGFGFAGRAETGPPTEYQVKAAFLYSITKFVEWPAVAIADPAQPFVICVLGTDPFGTMLDDAVNQTTVNGRPIVVRRVSTISSLDRVQLLFISATERDRLDQIVAALAGKPVLTVADMEPSACRGVVVVMSVGKDDRLKLAINADAAEQAGLTISSRLLRLADIIRD